MGNSGSYGSSYGNSGYGSSYGNSGYGGLGYGSMGYGGNILLITFAFWLTLEFVPI